MKKILIAIAALLAVSPQTSAKEKDYSIKFYGFVRNDIYSNSRSSVTAFDEAFFLFPLDVMPDANGQDLNAVPMLSMNAFVSRGGAMVTGPTILGAKSMASLEVDFAGYSGYMGTVRMRQAYFALDWTKHRLLIGQTWHPLFGQTMPDMQSLSTGAPFQPFNRSPQIQYKHISESGLQLTAATIWQYQYPSAGPEGKTNAYLKEGILPEIYIGADYKTQAGWNTGAGINILSLKPRTQSTVGDKTYKVNERVTAPTYEAHVSYKNGKANFAAKALYTSMIDYCASLSGYGISSVDAITGEQQYTPYRHATAWASFSYGTKWKPNIFVGYTKNLGTTKEMVANTPKYGLGLDVDQLLTLNMGLTYLFAKHWSVGAEYVPSTAWYGTADSMGRISNTHSVTNHRAYLLTVFHF